MHFHLPKPLHGWREFAGEVGIIVIGVLIALAAEQLIENWHWRSEVAEADHRMREDLGRNLVNAYERFAIEPCLRPRLSELRDELLMDRQIWPGSRAFFANDVYKSGFPSVYRTPSRTWDEPSWRTALSGEVLVHFNPDRAQQFASLFSLVDLLERNQAEEMDTAVTLGDLAFAGPISPADRRANLKAVAKLDALDARILFEARSLLQDARKAGIRPEPTSLQEAVNQQRVYRGPCVRTPAPGSF